MPFWRPRGCVLWLDFLEPSGSVTYDKSGCGNHGTIYGAKRVRALGCYGLSFDGVDDYVEVLHSDVLSAHDELTLEIIMKPHGTGGAWQALFSKGQDMNENYELLWNASNYFHTGWTFNTGRLHHDWYHPLRIGNFNHVVLTWEAPLIKLYVNGEYKETWDTEASYAVARTEPLLVGNEYGKTRYFCGIIALARIYDRPLTPREVKANYAYFFSHLKGEV